MSLEPSINELVRMGVLDAAAKRRLPDWCNDLTRDQVARILDPTDRGRLTPHAVAALGPIFGDEWGAATIAQAIVELEADCAFADALVTEHQTRQEQRDGHRHRV